MQCGASLEAARARQAATVSVWSPLVTIRPSGRQRTGAYRISDGSVTRAGSTACVRTPSGTRTRMRLRLFSLRPMRK